MREDLIAYALGELDESERERIDRALADDETLREELEQIKRCLSDVDCSDLEDEMPSNLADRTSAGIFSGCLGSSDESSATSAHGFSAASCIMSPMDMTVAIGVLITVASLLAPALYSSRNQSQLASCTNNLRQVGRLMQLYADQNPLHLYPVVRPTDHVGMFATRLREAEFVRPDVLDDVMLCSSSPLATDLASEGRSFHVPSLAELTLAKGMLRVELQRVSSGSYGYQPGYIKGNYYLPMRNFSNSKVPIVADAPSLVDNNRITANHAGEVVNTLFQDGSVLALTTPEVPCTNDPLFFNDNWEVAVGSHWNDAAVLPSGTTPVDGVTPMPERVYRLFFLRIP